MSQDPLKQDQRRQARLEPLREERRRCLRRAAAQLAWERGYAGISLGMAAVCAGLSRAQARALYARVSDLIADAMGVHLRAMAKRVEDFALGWDLEQPQFRPRVLEELAGMLLLAMTDERDAQRLCRSTCGLTQAQMAAVAQAHHGLHMSLAGLLMACLPGLAAAPEAAIVLARRFLCLLDQAAEDDALLHGLPGASARPDLLAAALIAMAPPAPPEACAANDEGSGEGEEMENGSPSPVDLHRIANPIGYSSPDHGATPGFRDIAIPPACVIGLSRHPATIGVPDTG